MNDETPKTGNVFSNRNFCLVFFGALVSELGALLYSFAVSFYILEISDSNAFLQGLYLALCGISMLLTTPLGGVLGDRFNKAHIMYICDLIKGGTIVLATLLLMIFREPGGQIAILFVLGIAGNAVSGIFSPVSSALFPHIVEEDRLQQANSYFAMKSALVGIFGTVLAGVLYSVLPVYALFFIVGVCFVLSGLSEMFIRYEHRMQQEKLRVETFLSDFREGISYLKTKKAILSLLAGALFINFFFTPVTGNFLPFFVKSDLANAQSYLFDGILTPELWLSVIDVLFTLSSLIGAAILSAKEQESKCGSKTARRILYTAVVLVGLTLLYWITVDRGVSMNGFLIGLSIGSLILGALISFINIPVSTAMMRTVDRDKLSKVSSIVSIGSQGMVPIASVLAGLILQTLGSTVLLAVCSVGLTAVAVMMLLSKSIREL